MMWFKMQPARAFTLRLGTRLKTNGFLGGSDMGHTFHKTQALRYPRAKLLPLPNSLECLLAAETSRFSPNRIRDINGSLLSGDVCRTYSDRRVRSYDCSGSINLSGHMQTNVPNPCRSEEFYTHFNMPGGLWSQGDKYVAEEHLISKSRSMFLHNYSSDSIKWSQGRHYSTHSPDKPSSDGQTRAQKLKTAVKEYGSVVIVFHVGISLLSLGACYLLVTSGLVDLERFLSFLGTSEGGTAAATAAPFVIAYAIHKSLAPVRITTTLISVPFIVRYLRRIGVMKPPKPPSP